MEQKNEAKKITEFGENEYVEFFEWLLDKQNIKLEKEIDISSCLEYIIPLKLKHFLKQVQ